MVMPASPVLLTTLVVRLYVLPSERYVRTVVCPSSATWTSAQNWTIMEISYTIVTVTIALAFVQRALIISYDQLVQSGVILARAQVGGQATGSVSTRGQ
jgi:hypothetical protein